MILCQVYSSLSWACGGSTPRASPKSARAAAEAVAAAGDGTDAIYLTVDMDAINSGEALGTGWPELGGLTGQQAIDFVRALAPHIAAMDIAELHPLYDTPARATALLAARLMLNATRCERKIKGLSINEFSGAAQRHGACVRMRMLVL
jgi:hypothetical protein